MTIFRHPGSRFAASFVVAALLATSLGAGDGGSATIGRRIDAIVDAAVDDGFAGGVAVWGASDTPYERVAGFADGAGRAPVTPSTLFHVASITKYFTATLVLESAQEGVLEPTRSIDPLVAGSGLEGRGFTWELLLSHRSGMGSSYAAENKADPDAAIEAIAVAPWKPEDRGSFRYSNDGYDLLAILLERVHATSYEDLLRERILRPAELLQVGFWADEPLTDPSRVGQPLQRVPRRLRKRNYGMIGSSGLLITAGDLVRFARALDEERLLAGEALQELRAPRGAMSLGEATFGGFLVDHPSLGRVLSARGYEDWGDNAILNHYLDRGFVVAVVTSRGPAESTGQEPFRSRIATAIERELASDASR